jgi:hypothetical protein
MRLGLQDLVLLGVGLGLVVSRRLVGHRPSLSLSESSAHRVSAIGPVSAGLQNHKERGFMGALVDAAPIAIAIGPGAAVAASACTAPPSRLAERVGQRSGPVPQPERSPTG